MKHETARQLIAESMDDQTLAEYDQLWATEKFEWAWDEGFDNQYGLVYRYTQNALALLYVAGELTELEIGSRWYDALEDLEKTDDEEDE